MQMEGSKVKPTKDGRWIADPTSNMALVKAFLVAGINDRNTIAAQTGLTRKQVGYAVRNLQGKGRMVAIQPSGSAGKGKGRTPAVYAPVGRKSQFAGVSSIFNMGV